MSATGHASVAGIACVSLTVYVPAVGPWWADAVLDGDADVSGSVEIAIGDSLTLRGTVAPQASGLFASTRSVRVVAGAGGWGTLLEPRAYHDDGAVAALAVARDAASAAGETLGDFAPTSSTLGADYVRIAGPASRALEDATGSAAWWVGFDGVTRVGSRPTSTPEADSYELLEYDPINRIATLAAIDLASISVGSVLVANERMPVAQTVRELRYEIGGDDARVIAWCGGFADERGRLVRSLRAIARRATDDRHPYPLRYRVIRMNGDRLDLQAVSDGAPDIGPIAMSPGVAGAHSEIAGGAVVLVSFVEGLRTLPIVTHFEGKGGAGWVPLNTTLDAQALIKIGANASQFVALATDTKARLDTLQSAHDAHKHAFAGTGTVGLVDVVVGALGPIAATKAQAE